MKDKQSKLCKNCENWSKGRCSVDGKYHLGNVLTNCEEFKGELQFVQWSKSHAIGYRPSTFSKEK